MKRPSLANLRVTTRNVEILLRRKAQIHGGVTTNDKDRLVEAVRLSGARAGEDPDLDHVAATRSG